MAKCPPPPCSLNCLFCFCCDQHPLHLMEIQTSDSGKIPSKNVPPFIVCFGTVLTCVSPFHEVSEPSHIFTAPSSLPGYLVVHYPPPSRLHFYLTFYQIHCSHHPILPLANFSLLNWIGWTWILSASSPPLVGICLFHPRPLYHLPPLLTSPLAASALSRRFSRGLTAPSTYPPSQSPPLLVTPVLDTNSTSTSCSERNWLQAPGLMWKNREVHP